MSVFHNRTSRFCVNVLAAVIGIRLKPQCFAVHLMKFVTRKMLNPDQLEAFRHACIRTKPACTDIPCPRCVVFELFGISFSGCTFLDDQYVLKDPGRDGNFLAHLINNAAVFPANGWSKPFSKLFTPQLWDRRHCDASTRTFQSMNPCWRLDELAILIFFWIFPKLPYVARIVLSVERQFGLNQFSIAVIEII